MKKLGLMILLSVVIYAYDISKTQDIVQRGDKLYKPFEDKPYSGIGKLTMKQGDKCTIIITNANKGVPNGKTEFWSCEGQLLRKGTMLNGKQIGVWERWDKKSGIKISKTIYSQEGKIISEESWNKNDGTKSSNLVYSKDGEIISGFQKYKRKGKVFHDLTYKDGKKSGWEKNYKKGTIVFYENGKIVKEVKK